MGSSVFHTAREKSVRSTVISQSVVSHFWPFSRKQPATRHLLSENIFRGLVPDIRTVFQIIFLSGMV